MKLDINLLDQQHDALREAVRELSAVLVLSLEEARPTICAVRSNLAHAVAKHLKTEHEMLVSPLMKLGLARAIPCFAGIMADTGKLRLAFSDHIAKWPMSELVARWPEYAASALVMRPALDDIIERKSRDLYPAARKLLGVARMATDVPGPSDQGGRLPSYAAASAPLHPLLRACS